MPWLNLGYSILSGRSLSPNMTDCVGYTVEHEIPHGQRMEHSIVYLVLSV